MDFITFLFKSRSAISNKVPLTEQVTIVGGRVVTLNDKVNNGGSASLVVEIKENVVFLSIARFSTV